MRSLLLILALCLPATGQIVQLTGGQSSFFQGTGAGVTAYLPGSTLYVGAGCTFGRCAFGVADSFDWRGWNITAGDSTFGFTLDTTGQSTQVRGISALRVRQQDTLGAFIGASAVGFNTPFFLGNTAQHVGAGLFYRRNVGAWKLGTLEVIDGGKRTAVQGASYAGTKLHFAATGGLLQNTKLVNVQADYQVLPALRIAAAHLNYFYEKPVTADMATASAVLGHFTAQASALRGTAQGRTITGTALGGGVHYGPVSLQSNWYHSGTQQVLTHVAQEQVQRHWSLSQTIAQANGSATYSAGGEYHSNRISVSVSHGMAFFPLGGRGWQQVTSVAISLRIPHTDAAVNVATTLLPTGETKYTAYGSTWAKGPLHLQATAPQAKHTHSKGGRYLVSGTVTDRKGQPVTGAAVAVGNDTVFSNSAGAFYVRLRHAQPVPVRVLPDEFAAPGTWAVVSAPDQAQAGQPVMIVVELN